MFDFVSALWARALLIFLLPLVVSAVAVALMQAISQRRKLKDVTPLNSRFRGYSPAMMHGVWEQLDAAGRRAEQRFLELDLVFPTLYGVALGASLLTAWRLDGVSSGAAWVVVAPVVVAVVADWLENLIHLDQLRSHVEAGEAGLSARWIRFASGATQVKLASIVLSFVLLAWLLVRAVLGASAPG